MSEDQNNIVTLKVRVTAEFREKIATTAKENNRSMNAEIVARLEESFNKGKSQDDELVDLKKEIRNLNMTIHTLAEALVK